MQVIGGAGGFSLIVFATPTIKAPNILGGIIITAFVYLMTLFALLGLFRKQSLAKAVQHLLIATVVAVSIGLIGGIFWVQENPTELFSLNYFTSVAHIAGMVGIFFGSLADAAKK